MTPNKHMDFFCARGTREPLSVCNRLPGHRFSDDLTPVFRGNSPRINKRISDCGLDVHSLNSFRFHCFLLCDFILSQTILIVKTRNTSFTKNLSSFFPWFAVYIDMAGR